MGKIGLGKVRRNVCLLVAVCAFVAMAAGCGDKPVRGIEGEASAGVRETPDNGWGGGKGHTQEPPGTKTPEADPDAPDIVLATGTETGEPSGTFEPDPAAGAQPDGGADPDAVSGTDPEGNPGTAEESEKKLLALTFDDGPDENYTPQILDLLKEYEVKATFFLVGLQTDKYPEMAERIAQEGHSIGGHSWSHKDLTDLDGEKLETEIDRAQAAIADATGTEPDLFRAPYGALDDEVLATVRERGLTHVRWNIDPRDWAGTPVADMEKNILDNVRPGAVVLLHSFGGRKHAIEHTIEMLPQLIEQLQADGYTLVTVDELIASGQASESVIQN